MVAARRPPRRWTLAVLLLAFILLAAVGSLTRFYTDLLWFREVDKTTVFWGQLTAKLTLGLLAGIGTALVIGVNLWLVERLAPRYGLVVVGRPQVERYRAILAPYLRPLRIGVAAFLGLIVGLQSASLWQTFVLWRNAVPFDDKDAQFGRDVGFYVFQLPFLRAVFGWLFTTLVLATLLAAAGHYLLGGIRPQAESNRVAPQVQAHLSILVGLIIALKAWGYYLDRFELVHSPRGVVTGASYTDVHAQLPALSFMFYAAIICAGLFFWGARSRGLTFPIAGIVLLGLTSILVGGLYPGIVQRFSVAPQELRREAPYIQRNITATRKAFGLDKVETKSFAASADLRPADLRANEPTISNIRLWDPDVLKPAVRNLQAIAPYYSFSDVDVDRYRVDGDIRQVMISSREVDSNLLSASAKTWQNLHLTYTHGYGVVATQVNTAGTQGQPDFIVSNFDLTNAKIPVEQPRIYFGEPPENATEYVVVRTKQAEVDAPSVSGATSSTTSYTGQGGIPTSNMLRRLAFALRFREFNLLISGNITGDSRLIFNRDIRDRVEKVAPFLQWDGDPYAVVVDGRIKFVRDGYTTTDKYPYSQRIDLGEAARRDLGSRGVQGRGNYIRNSVKAVVDAYDGSIKLYAFDVKDPILGAWRKAFPDLFAPTGEMGPSLLQHLRYPEDLFSIQTERYASYHVDQSADFYSREDFWALPDDRSGQIRRDEGAGGLLAETRVKMRPYYLLTKLPGQEAPQFLLVMPFTPNGKENMIAYMAVTSDPEDYGKIQLFSLDRSKTVFGPTQVNARILANREVSSQVSLLNQQGSKVILGNLLIVPIKDSLLYVQPLFVQGSAANSIPLLTNVAVFYNSQVGYATNLTDAINQVVEGGGAPEPPGGPTTPPPPGTSSTVPQLLAEADREFKAGQEALKRGNLAEYQAHINRAGQLIQQALAAGGSGQGSATTTTTPKG